MKKLLFACLIASVISAVTQSQTIDQAQSKVTFKIDNLLISSVEGTIEGLEGKVDFNPDNLQSSSFNVCIDPETIATGNKKRDEHLREEDFFYTEKYPTICFQSALMKLTEEGFIAVGNLSIKGISKEVSIPFNYANDQFEGRFEVNRLKFNLGNNYGSFTAGEEVEVNIICKLKE